MLGVPYTQCYPLLTESKLYMLLQFAHLLDVRNVLSLAGTFRVVGDLYCLRESLLKFMAFLVAIQALSASIVPK